MKMKTVFFVACLTLMQACNNLNDQNIDYLYSKGRALLKSDKPKAGFPYLLNCAARGHGGCAEIIAYEYYGAEHIDEDLDEALKWFKVAASTKLYYGFAGISGALTIAEMYCDGTYFSESYTSVNQWVEEANSMHADLTQIFVQQNVPEHFYQILEGIRQRITELERSIAQRGCRTSE
ncbi:hypothetical protein [Glaciecola sp. SC05]|uniref:hypothetical protein n=1 Tax=Glaciecola sp. SC05 TaxID=1987355 RepID=UPI0035282566